MRPNFDFVSSANVLWNWSMNMATRDRRHCPRLCCHRSMHSMRSCCANYFLLCHSSTGSYWSMSYRVRHGHWKLKWSCAKSQIRIQRHQVWTNIFAGRVWLTGRRWNCFCIGLKMMCSMNRFDPIPRRCHVELMVICKLNLSAIFLLSKQKWKRNQQFSQIHCVLLTCNQPTWLLSIHRLVDGFWTVVDNGGGIFKLDRLPSRVFTEMVDRLRPFAALVDPFVSLAIDETSSSDEYRVAYSVSRRNFDFSLSIRLRRRLIRILRVVLVTGIFGTPNCAKRYCSSSLLSSFKSSMSHKPYIHRA